MSERPAKVDQLVEELRDDGTTVDAGEFTLDRKVALEKLKAYQLAEPHAYVLELVQAMVLKGATYVDFRVDTDDMWLRGNGRPFTAGELERVYEAVFHSAADDDARALSQLALGLNGALGLDPRWIRVISGERKSRVAMELRRGRADHVAPTRREPRPVPEKAPVTTEIQVKARWRPALLERFFQNLAGILPEERALRRGCRYASVDISLDGAPIFDGLDLRGAVATEPIVAEGVRGIAGVLPSMEPPRVHWVMNSVCVATHTLESKGDEGFVAVVEADGLQKDLSQGDLVLDERYKEIVVEVQRVRRTLRKDSKARQAQDAERLEEAGQLIGSFYPRLRVPHSIFSTLGRKISAAALVCLCCGALGAIIPFIPGLPNWAWALVFVPELLALVMYLISWLCDRLAAFVVGRGVRSVLKQYPYEDPFLAIVVKVLRSQYEERLARRIARKLEDGQRSFNVLFHSGSG